MVVGAPGRITYLDSTTPFYWGTKDFAEIFGQEIDLDVIRNVPVRLLIGKMDTLPVGRSAWGNTRMERLLNLKENWEKHGISVSMEIIPGIGHKGNDAIKALFVIDFFQEILNTEAGKKCDCTKTTLLQSEEEKK